MTFVTVEGLDGSGKTTALDAISEIYEDAIFTAEPSTLWTGQNVRNVLAKDDSPPLMDFYLFMADRIHHIEEKVEPADSRGELVVSDRYADSTRAYQPVAMVDNDVFESQWEAKDFIERTMRPWNYEPDVTLYLDVSVDTAIERSSGDEKYENREFLERVRNNYEALASSDEYGHRIIRIDAEQSRSKVRDEVREVVAAAVDPAGSVEGW